MTNEQAQVRDWMKSFGQETPEKPIIPSLEIRKLRAKLILEETTEVCKALGFDIEFDMHENSDSNFLFENHKPNLKEILDGCEDLKVVTEGTLIACGLTVDTRMYSSSPEGFDPHFNEVMRSNWSKMWTGEEIGNYFGPNGENVEPHCIADKDHYIDDQREIKRVIYTEGQDRCWLVKDSSGKVIKSPSYSPPNFKI